MQKLYFACSITHAPTEFQTEMNKLKDLLCAKYDLEQVSEDKLTDNNVLFKHYTDRLKNCDIILAECSHPSTGLGFEIAYALQNHKPIIAVAKPDANVTRFILGINNSLFSFVRYQNLDEVVDAVEKKLAGVI